MRSVLGINYLLSFIGEEVEGHEHCRLSKITKLAVAEPGFGGRSLDVDARIVCNPPIDTDTH